MTSDIYDLIAERDQAQRLVEHWMHRFDAAQAALDAMAVAKDDAVQRYDQARAEAARYRALLDEALDQSRCCETQIAGCACGDWDDRVRAVLEEQNHAG